MTTLGPAPPQPPIPDRNGACSIGGTPSKTYSNTRGYSDSAIPGCRTSVMQDYVNDEVNAPVQSDLAGVVHEPGTQLLPNSLSHNDLAAGVSELAARSKLGTPQVKTRQNLQLPSFKTLGILSRVPDGLLTPPEDNNIDLSLAPPHSQICRSSSYPPANMPKTPSPDRTDNAVMLGSDLATTAASSSTQPATTAAEPTENAEKQRPEPVSSSSEDEIDPSQAGWIVKAVDAAVFSIDPNASNVVSVLCHSQPCPLPNSETGGEVTTAFHGVVAAVQNRIESNDRPINITHAIPLRFSMGQIPNSPVTTPNLHSIGGAVTDYFSLQTNVFSNAVVAMGHKDALNTSVPSSPHPVVPPSSMSISLLERFIPPSSAEEYLHLFATDGPSVLVDRLIELSPNGGSLIFIYPTADGANTFATTYLGPLLHPLLRTMCSIHNLSMDFGAGVGKIAAVDQMLTFEATTRKITLLLRKLTRGNSTIHRIAPRYTLVEYSKQSVELDRKTWTDWWTHQETPRIRTVVDRYLKRGAMMPNKDVTAATLVQEVLDGVREGRKYADYDVEREGVEMGVFVIKRTG